MILENCETTSSITIHSGNKFFAELLKAYLDNLELSKQALIDINYYGRPTGLELRSHILCFASKRR